MSHYFTSQFNNNNNNNNRYTDTRTLFSKGREKKSIIKIVLQARRKKTIVNRVSTVEEEGSSDGRNGMAAGNIQ